MVVASQNREAASAELLLRFAVIATLLQTLRAIVFFV